LWVEGEVEVLRLLVAETSAEAMRDLEEVWVDLGLAWDLMRRR